MAFIRKKTIFSKNDGVEKTKILEAFWRKCFKAWDQDGVAYLISQLEKYKKERPLVSQPFIQDKIDLLKNEAMTCEHFVNALQWITPLEAKLIDLFENLKVIDQIEHESFDEIQTDLKDDDLQIVKEYLDEMKMSVSMTIGNVKEQKIHSVRSSNISTSVPFATHSVTKIFTGVLVLKMVEDNIISESTLNKSIKDLISKEAWDRLQIPVQQHLENNNITLYQLMTHKGDLGDYYNNPGGYREMLEKNIAIEIKEVQDFLQFSESEIKNKLVSAEPYSNLGITLVGLAIEEGFRRNTNSNANWNFNDILYELVLKPANIQRSDFTKNMPINGRYNKADPIAKDWIGGPAGGYWAKSETLAEFSKWLYKECQYNQNFMTLIRKYGQEFYKEDRNVIEHAGTFNSASAFFYLSLNTGNMINILSDQQLIAPILMSTIKRSLFCTPSNNDSTKELNEIREQTKRFD